MKLLFENWRNYLEESEQKPLNEGLWGATKTAAKIAKAVVVGKAEFPGALNTAKKSLKSEGDDEIENKKVFYVDVDLLLPTQELGHGKDHDCPGPDCETVIQSKMNDIEKKQVKALEVSNRKPIRPYRIQRLEVGKAPKSEVEEPFYHVLNGHHRLEAAKRLGVKELPVFLTPEDEK